MSNNQKLFKDAIADAKTLREVAVANAKAALEESFMPRIQSMFEKRIMENEELEEAEEELKEKATYIVDKDNLIDSLDENEEMEEGMEDSMEEEIDLEELFNSLSEDEDPMYEMDSELSEEDLEENYDLEEILRELEEESNEIYEEEEMEEGKDEELNENTMFEKASGKENIDEVTVDELRDMIQDAIRAVMGGEEGVSGEEMDMDMEDDVVMESDLSEKTKKNVPTNPSLWKKSLAWAKSRYKVCPSAYCNGAAAKHYKSKGGKWKRK